MSEVLASIDMPLVGLVVLVLHRLLKPVNGTTARLMVMFVVADVQSPC